LPEFRKRWVILPIHGHFDHYVCVNSEDTAGRTKNEIPTLLASGLIAAGVNESDISLVLIEHEWWQSILAMGTPGDLIVLLPDSQDVQTIWDLLESITNEQASTQ
jgi:hypothetical protein